MQAPVNQFKQALKAGQVQIGFWQSLGSRVTAEISAHAGFDWLLLDGEHGPNDLRDLRDLLQVVDPTPSRAVVRIADIDPVRMKQAMDAGAQTVLVPMVETAEQAELMVRAMRYAPEGIRGNAAGVVRASLYGARSGYVENANAEASLLVQVESLKAVENLAAICAVDGVDGVFIGPADLATSMGHIAEPNHPEVLAVIDETIRRIVAAGKAAGILVFDRAAGQHFIDLGARFVAVGVDVALFARNARELAASYKDEAAAPQGRAY